MEKPARDQVLINNDFYETLHDGWHTAQDHPIALLRAENAVRTPWIADEIGKRFDGGVDVLDIGCGGGLLTNYLAKKGQNVTGIDISQSSIDIAKQYDETKKVRYLKANAYELPFSEECFEVVCAMDILEHVEDPSKLIQEASRVLKPGGVFFFHTFNRNLLSKFLVIKGIDYFVKNAPKNMHVYHLFIKPVEIIKLNQKAGLTVEMLIGLAPTIWHSAFWKLVFTRKVPKDFSFHFTKSLLTGYCGIAVKD
ncbi:MAG: 3-demethylubiquinone-9 3-O-methyltransferase [Parachlamydiaceae bacterium]|nr:3-demethylubiquinone-9 3-O-methyltransferase [Parachlamydiaceae bacterium]